MSRILKLLAVLPLLAACALGDAGEATPAAPVTLLPPPEMTFRGSCDNTRDLELWLQITTRLASEFLQVMNDAAGRSKGEIREALSTMAALRDSTHQAVTPDCAVDSEILLGDAMNRAITAFQEYVNGARTDLGNTVAETNDQIEQVIAIQNELTLRLDTQLQQALATVTPG
ncbi:MAG: hypothetical protein HZC41_17255 [Chloroflexi bacterium]|nr:hypothetical protein [Chloroflexota bacterium]